MPRNVSHLHVFLSLSVTLVEVAAAEVGMIVAMQRRVGNFRAYNTRA
jgi:hypothetical protein